MKRLLVSLLFAALTAFGADVAGKWKATYQTQDGPREVTFNFQVNEGKLSGTVTGASGDAPLTGRVDGDKLNFTIEKDNFKAVVKGTVDGDKLKLTATVGEKSYDLAGERL